MIRAEWVKDGRHTPWFMHAASIEEDKSIMFLWSVLRDGSFSNDMCTFRSTDCTVLSCAVLHRTICRLPCAVPECIRNVPWKSKGYSCSTGGSVWTCLRKVCIIRQIVRQDITWNHRNFFALISPKTTAKKSFLTRRCVLCCITLYRTTKQRLEKSLLTRRCVLCCVILYDTVCGLQCTLAVFPRNATRRCGENLCWYWLRRSSWYCIDLSWPSASEHSTEQQRLSKALLREMNNWENSSRHADARVSSAWYVALCLNLIFETYFVVH